MASGGLLRLWSEHGVQFMVLFSFALQLFLLACGGIRRRSSSTALRIGLWLAYLFADSTAIYALGHLSVTSGSGRSPREDQLVAFWAPFLLLHLGGPDNITAYALEDNRLWLRHLQTLGVQAVGAAYVIYKYIVRGAGGGTLLLLAASICMFAAGLVKYGERIWALKCGNISSLDWSDKDVKISRPLRRRRRRRTSDGGGGGGEEEGEENRNNNSHYSMEGGGREEDEIMDEEEILLGAHSHFDICKGAFTDAGTVKHGAPLLVLSKSKDIVDLFKLVEMELSLMYDVLYTKAAVIHTWYGFCIHSVSLLATAAAFVLFQLSIIHGSVGDDGYTYSNVDVVISYVLLAGALALEAMSLCRAIFSSWTCCLLLGGLDGSGWKKWLLAAITSLPRRVQLQHQLPASRRLWSGSIGQYNLLDVSSSDRSGILCWLAQKVRVESWWNKLRLTTTFSGTEFCSVEDLKVLVLREMATNVLDVARVANLRGTAALGRNGGDRYRWTIDKMDLDMSILVWHVVTDLVIRAPMDDGDNNQNVSNKGLVEATRVLSNYMMYLLVVNPNMLPGRSRRKVYLDACKEVGRCWRDCSKAWSPGEEAVSRPRGDMLADWLLADLYHHTWRKHPDDHPYDIESHREAPEHAKAVYNAIWIYEDFRSTHHDTVKWLEMIFQVWVEMMEYVAEHCSRDSHARHLNHGGELMTIIWLMMHHLEY